MPKNLPDQNLLSLWFVFFPTWDSTPPPPCEMSRSGLLCLGQTRKKRFHGLFAVNVPLNFQWSRSSFPLSSSSRNFWNFPFPPSGAVNNLQSVMTYKNLPFASKSFVNFQLSFFPFIPLLRQPCNARFLFLYTLILLSLGN